jgi:hypothetical protein
MLRVTVAVGACLLTASAWSVDSFSATLQRDSSRCQAGNVDACYDAIRWNPRDPALLVGLGDGLARAGKTADAIRYYRRAATMSPSVPGLSAKINLLEARMTAKRAPARPVMTAANAKPAAKQFSNAAPETESH